MRTGDIGSRAQIVQIHHNLQLDDAGYDHDSADQEVGANGDLYFRWHVEFVDLAYWQNEDHGVHDNVGHTIGADVENIRIYTCARRGKIPESVYGSTLEDGYEHDGDHSQWLASSKLPHIYVDLNSLPPFHT